MIRAACLVAALVAVPIVAEAQQPCTKDARAVVSEIYTRILERPFEDSGIGWVQAVENGQSSVRDIVEYVIKSDEYSNKFLGNQQTGTRNIYRHLLGRAPSAQEAKFMATAPFHQTIDAILTSDEYMRRYSDSGVPGSRLRFCDQWGTSGFRTSQMRFEGMDRNNDGMIARTEWNGSRQSFSTHDWNGDGVLSGEEVAVGGRRPTFDDFDPSAPGRVSWDAQAFTSIDRNRDGRIAASEWYYDTESFIRADRNRDGMLTRAEFLAEDNMDDDRDDRFTDLDVNGNGRVERGEWHASADAFTWLDRDGNGILSRAEVLGGNNARDQFASLDANGDNRLSTDEWPWSQRSFAQQDGNRDGILTRQEFVNAPQAVR